MEKESTTQSKNDVCGKRESDEPQIPSCSKKSRNNMNINDLPEEMLQKILSYLSINEKFRYERVCQRWQKNVFSSVTKLAIYAPNCPRTRFSFCSVREHSIVKQDVLHGALVRNSDTIQLIVSKCGKYVRSISGFATEEIVSIIAENCERLECCSLTIPNSTSLELISSKFGQHLTCAAVPLHLETEFVPFITACPKLSSFSVFRVDIKESYTWEVPSQMFNVSSEFPEPSQNPLSKIRSLAIDLDKDSNDILYGLPEFNNLATIYIRLECNLNQELLWKSVMQSWTSLRSLSIDMTYDNYVSFGSLPPNLEYLYLKEGEREIYQTHPIIFSTNLPKLKILKVYPCCLEWMGFCELLSSISACFHSLEVLNFKCENIEEPDDDTMCYNTTAFQPLLSMISLKELTLSMPLELTKKMNDNFSSNLISSLINLRIFGEDRFYVSPDSSDCFYRMPRSSEFWKTLKKRAKANSSDLFHITGEVKTKLHLDEKLPRNIILQLCGKANISLSESFGTSKQWLELTERSYRLKYLNLEVWNSNVNLNGLPKSIEHLTINCNNEAANTDALVLNNRLPNLKELIIVQKFMSNDQLGATLDSVGTAYPNLELLSLHRENRDPRPVDRHMVGLFNCNSLQRLSISEMFFVTDVFGAELVNKLKDLSCLYSSTNEIGINCGPLILRALHDKAMQGKACGLHEGPSKDEIEVMIAPLSIPENFFVKSKYENEDETSEDDGYKMYASSSDDGLISLD